MKTYQDLTPELQANAREIALTQLLEGITGGIIRFNDELNGDGLQARIDAAGDKANDLQTPWFWAEIILETCREDLEGMALCDAEDALYPEAGERMIYLEGI